FVPPLRERREDIPLLAAHFIGHFSTEMGFPPPPISTAALAMLAGHAFPGNVRELRNLIESALIASGGRAIAPTHLRLTPLAPAASRANPAPAQEPPEDLPLNLESAERILIRRALNQTGGNIAEASRLLGVHRSRIYRVLEEVSA
ncbi:MAG TPA: helix-turn-helix domain-containing protein, partial [Opitutaceae bacterium]|nr:helix-turn-helix domain-containing protein [Opitutaceae bacterium]